MWRNLFEVAVRIPALLVGGVFLVLATYHVLTVSHETTVELLRNHLSLLALTVVVIGANIGNYFALRSKERVEILNLRLFNNVDTYVKACRVFFQVAQSTSRSLKKGEVDENIVEIKQKRRHQT